MKPSPKTQKKERRYLHCGKSRERTTHSRKVVLTRVQEETTMPTLVTAVVSLGISCMHGTVVEHLCHPIVQAALLQQCFVSNSTRSSRMANT